MVAKNNIDIKSSAGKTLLSVLLNIGAKGYYSLMQHDYIVLPFKLCTPIDFKIGSYVDLRGVFDDALGGKLAKMYYITDKQNPTYNTSTGAYEYQLRLNAYYWLWNNFIFKYTPENAAGEASWSLTAPLDVQMGVFLRNLSALGFTYNGTPYEVEIDDTVENKAVAMTYDNMHLLDALFSMGSKDNWDCDVWVTENVIHFGRCEHGDPVKIELGVEASTMTRSESKGTFATRIYAFGSTRNIPENYRPADESLTVNGVVQKRLMLPVDTPYIDAYPGMAAHEVVEAIVVFDDIFPRRIGTISDVRTVDRAVTGESGEQVDTFKAYQYRDSELSFKEDYVLPGKELRVIFKSGKLNGLDFAVQFNPENADPAEQLWEIVANEDYGRLLPDETIKPEDGDTYLLYGFDIQLVSDQYTPEAEQELKERTENYVKKTMVDDGTYATTLRNSWVSADPLRRTFDVGQRVKLLNPGYFPAEGRESRVIGWEMNLDIPSDAPIYTIGESTKYSRIGEIEDKVDTLVYKGSKYVGVGGSGVYVVRVNDSTPPSDTNVFSALRSLATFLRKDQEDTAQEVITFLKGLRIAGHYISKVILSPEELEEADDAIMSVLKAVNTFIRKDKADATNFLLKLVGGAEFGNYEAGKSGGKVDAQGTAELLSLLVRGLVTASGIESADFSTGALGTGFTLKIDENGDSYIEVDRMLVRKVATFVELLIQKIRAVGGQIILSPATMNCSRVEEHDTFYRCFFENTDGEKTIAQEFVVGDQARCQTFNVKEGVNENVTNTYYWRLVVGVGDDYIDLSKTDCDAGSTVPQAGDDIVQLGNRTDATRQAAIVLAAYGNDAPYFKMYRGIDSYSLSGKEFISFSRTEVMIIADSLRFSTGESVKDYIDNATGNAITSVDVEYALGDSPTEAPQTGWSTTAPEWQAGKYMWQRTKTTTPKGSSYSEPTCIQGAKGEDGADGVPGADGKDGKTLYTWIRYADNAAGAGISNDPTGKPFIGFAYNKESASESDTPSDYTWSEIKGEQGVPGATGEDGKTLYTWIAYSDNANGRPMYQQPKDTTQYIGIATNKESASESDNPNDYTWSKFKGEKGDKGDQGERGLQGLQGEKGEQGIPGNPGKTLYTWIRYADNANGDGISNSPTGKAFIGFAYNKETATESNIPSDYTWSDIKGEQGVKGDKGDDGTQYYTWIKYSDNASGSGMYDTPKTTTQYIGIAVNKTSPTESNTPTDYTWSKFKGDKGDQGPQGIPGADGADGRTSYFHIKYSSKANPTSAADMTETPSEYIGTYVDYTAADSTDPSDYTWSRFQGIQGEKGDQGIPGTNGADGKTYYLHIAYANSADGSQEFSTTDSTNKLYIGQYTDTTQDDSPDHKKYSWTKIKGDTGKGVSALEEQYYLSTSNTTQTGGTWQTTCPAWESGKYIWTRTKVTWTDNTVTYTTPVLAEDINDLGAKLEQAISDLAENIGFVNSLSEELGTVKDQVDGAIETWFYDPVPTLTNAPASSWTTTELKNQHLGDLYYDGNGKAYRFQMSGSNYVWQVITDTDITKALANAQKAQDTADGKRRVFVTTPTNASAYDVGDLWVNATYGSYSNDLLRCKTAKAAGAAWNISHWEKASKYTDDSKANQAIADAAEAMAAANNAQSTATAAKNRLDGWAADNVISPTEKQGLKDEIARIDGDKSEITANYTKYGLGTPTAYNNAHSAYRAVLVTLSAATPETIAIPSDFATKQTAYYTARTDALTAIADAAKAYVDSIEIGGRNLLMRTNQGTVNWSLIVSEQGHTQMTAWGEGVEFNVSSVFSGYAIVFYKLGETLSMLEPNTEYMLSFDVWCDISVGITVGIKNSNATGSLSNVAQFNTIANQTVHVATKLTTKDLTEYLRSQGLYFDGFNAYVATYRFKNLKMEKGNKATGWTPAPEDAENALNDYKEEVEAKFEATNESITAAVESSKSYTDEKGESILLQTTSMINVAKDEINLSVDTKIDNLVIGGRNLLKYSALEKTPLNNMVYGRKPENAPVGVEEGYKGARAVKLVFTTPSKMSVNEVMWRTWEERQAYNRVEPVVLRFWAKADKDNTRMWTVLGYHGGKFANPTISSEWKEYTVNFMPDGPWALWCIGLDAPGTVWISRPKLEYGTKPTDWTPAPEDVDNSITELSSRIEVTEESIKNTVSKTEFNSLSGTVSNHTSQITQLNNQITSKVSSSELTEKLKGYVTTTTYNNKMSSIDQSLSSITSRVSSTETEINTIDGSLQSITQRVTTAEQKITDDAIKLTVKEQTKQIADEAVKDLELGGRNILLNTKVIGEANTNRINGQLQLKATIQSETYRGFSVCMAKGSTTKYTEILQYLITEFELGDIFTYSFYTKGTAKTLSVYFYGEHGYVRAKAIASSDGKAAGTSFGDGRRDIAVTGEWRRVWVTYQLNSSGDTSIPKCLLIRNQPNSGGDIYVCAPKLEKGSKATDWTPAPEDYSTTSEIKSSFTMTSSGISLLGQNISLTGKVTFSMLASDVQGDLNKLDGLGDLAYKDKVSDAMLDETVIVGGYLKTSLIDVDNLYVKHLEGADGVFTGSLQAATGSFSGEVTAKSGKIGGWRISEHDLHSEDFVYPDFTQPSGGNGGGLVSGGNGSMMRTDGIIINSTENGVLPASSGSIMAALINASGDNAWVQGAYIGAHCSSTYGYLSQVVALELSATNAYSGTPMNTPIALKIANGFPDIPGVLLAGYVYSSGISSKYKYGKKRTTSGAYQSTYGYGGVKQYQIIHNLGHSNYVVLVTPVSIGASWRKYHAHIVSQGPSDFFVAFIDSGTEGTLVQSDFMFAMIGNNT